MALDLLDAPGKPVRERDAAGRDAEQDDIAGAVGPLENLVRDPGDRPPDLGRLEDRTARRPGSFRPGALGLAASGTGTPGLVAPGAGAAGRAVA